MRLGPGEASVSRPKEEPRVGPRERLVPIRAVSDSSHEAGTPAAVPSDGDTTKPKP